MDNMTGLFDPSYSAVDLFTDRISESQAVADALLSHVERLLSGRTNFRTAERHNILTFYGVGGVGKTELSRRLELWINNELAESTQWGRPPVFDQTLRTVRIDLHGRAMVNPIDVVLRLRTAVAGIRRRYWAFDIALSVWWSHARPGEPLPVLRTPSGLNVNGMIADTIKDAINAEEGAILGVGPVGVRVAARLIAAARDGVVRHLTQRDCPQLVPVLDAAQRDASPAVAAALAGLLTWDIEQLTVSEQPIIVAFVDAAEYVQSGDRQQEKLLHSLVRNTPSVMWLVTSRNSLDWAEPTAAVALDRGPIAWPGLKLGNLRNPRQHLVGDLADEDVLRYLSTASGTAGVPELSTAIVDRVRAGAHGLPLYLDLSMALARSTTGRLDPADFGQPLPDLAVRVLADLPDAERDLARIASLLPRFSPDLIADAGGGRYGDAERFCSRSLVSHDGHAAFPYRLHDAVRAAVANENSGGVGAWSARDRRAAAAILVQTLRRRHDQLVDDAVGRLDVLELIAWVAAAQRMQLTWLLTALTNLPSLARTAERIPESAEGTWMWFVRQMFNAYREVGLAARRSHLERLLAVPGLPEDVRRAVTLRLAYNIRSGNQRPLALQLLNGLLAHEPESNLLRYQIARTLRDQERYSDLQAFLAEYPIDESSAAQRLAADLAFDRGEVVVGYEGALARAAALRADGRVRNALENEVAALWRGALAGLVTPADCDRIVAEVDMYGTRLGLRGAFAAKAVCCLSDPTAFAAMEAANEQVISAVYGRRGWREWTVAVLHGLRHDDPVLITRTRAEWLADQSQVGPDYRVLDNLLVHAGYEPALPAAQLGSDDHLDRINARWTSVFRDILDR